MNQEEQWLLPDGVDEILPRQAVAVEALRRKLLDQFSRWGYQLVFPPLIEFLESLLNGAGRDLEHETFKLTDQLSGRQVGVRADMTPQVARMDAHSLRREGPARLCYCSTALRTRADTPGASRLPYQIGVELFGHAGFESDAEVIGLLLETLAVASKQVTLELGHVGIFRALVANAGLDDAAIDRLSDIYLRKSIPELKQFLEQLQLPPATAALLAQLPRLCGDADLLPQARDSFECVPGAQAALDELSALVTWVKANYPAADIYLDLSELRGYHYHTGSVFAAYLPNSSEPVAKGGRYDHIGEVFGRARPATGFSADLKALSALCPTAPAMAILAQGSVSDKRLREAVANLRDSGEKVIWCLPGVTNDPQELGCDRRLLIDADGQPQIISSFDSE